MRFIPAGSGGYQQITSLSAAAGLTLPTTAIAIGAWVQAQDQNVRWRGDGTDPTSTVGMILYAGDPPTYFSENLDNPTQGLAALKFIQTTASAKLNVTYVSG